MERSLHKVAGIVSHVIVFLYSLEWIPHNFNEWEDASGNIWITHKEHNLPTPINDRIQTVIYSYHKLELADVENTKMVSLSLVPFVGI